MRDIKLHALELLDKMHTAPAMWAYTKEAFVAQVAIILDFTGDMSGQDFMRKMFPRPSNMTVLVTTLTGPFEDSWAREVVNYAKPLIRI